MIDITNHPLAPFFANMAREYDKGLAKYGPWSEIPDHKQASAVKDEFCEWTAAYYNFDVHGEHGELAELPQLANVAGKRWLELRNRGESA